MGWSEFDEEEAQAIQARVDTEVAAAVRAEREKCQAFAVALSDEIAEAEGMIHSERLGGNVVKENWWRGKLTGLRAAQAMHSNAPHEGADAALSRTLPLDVVVGPLKKPKC